MANKMWPASMLRQVFLLLMVAGLVMVLAGAAGGFLLRRSFDTSPSVMVSLLNSMVIAQLNSASAAERADILAQIGREAPDLEIAFIDDAALPPVRRFRPDGRKGPFQLGETLFGVELVYVEGRGERPEGAPPILYFRLADGQMVRATWARGGPPPPNGFWPQVILVAGFVGLTFAGLMVWAARGVVRPLGNLAEAAAGFGQKGVDPVPIPEVGPAEVQAASAAFNRMQHRINEFVDTRTRTLAAISHDLRTPLTRLRLRLELLEDGEIKQRSLADLEIMDQQLSQALAYLKGGASAEPAARIDLGSLLQSICDQYADTGWRVTLETEPGLTISARNNDLMRALCNLIDNANHYADGAKIALQRDGDAVVLRIADHGPGIKDADKERLLQPFERGDGARQLRAGTGFGLGLATAKAIVEANYGQMVLSDTPGGGLTVALRFPLVKTKTG